MAELDVVPIRSGRFRSHRFPGFRTRDLSTTTNISPVAEPPKRLAAANFTDLGGGGDGGGFDNSGPAGQGAAGTSSSGQSASAPEDISVEDVSSTLNSPGFRAATTALGLIGAIPNPISLGLGVARGAINGVSAVSTANAARNSFGLEDLSTSRSAGTFARGAIGFADNITDEAFNDEERSDIAGTHGTVGDVGAPGGLGDLSSAATDFGGFDFDLSDFSDASEAGTAGKGDEAGLGSAEAATDVGGLGGLGASNDGENIGDAEAGHDAGQADQSGLEGFSGDADNDAGEGGIDAGGRDAGGDGPGGDDGSGSGGMGGDDGNDGSGHDGDAGGDFRVGGFIKPDGDGKFEAVPVNAHEGEFVIRPEAVSQFGLAFLEKLNRGEIDPTLLGKSPARLRSPNPVAR